MTDDRTIRDLDDRLRCVEIQRYYMEDRVRRLEGHRDILAVILTATVVALVVYGLVMEVA